VVIGPWLGADGGGTPDTVVVAVPVLVGAEAAAEVVVVADGAVPGSVADDVAEADALWSAARELARP
jgi:hypothetical protein